jgi:kynurenine formamidase
VRSGWSQKWSDPDAFVGRDSGVPGVSESGARWLAAHRPTAVGADTIAFECLPPGAGHALLPAHRILLVEEGIYIIETMALDELASLLSDRRLSDNSKADARKAGEFVLIVSPLHLVGATGSPVRPLAVL